MFPHRFMRRFGRAIYRSKLLRVCSKPPWLFCSSCCSPICNHDCPLCCPTLLHLYRCVQQSPYISYTRISVLLACFRRLPKRLSRQTSVHCLFPPSHPAYLVSARTVAGRQREQHSCFKNNLVKLKSEIDALILCILRHLPDTVEGFDRFSSPRVGDGGSGRVAGTTASSSTAKLSLSSSIVRDVSVAGGRGQGESGAAGGALRTSGAGIIFVQEMLEPELAGLQPRHCSGPLAQARDSNSFNVVVDSQG